MRLCRESNTLSLLLMPAPWPLLPADVVVSLSLLSLSLLLSPCPCLPGRCCCCPGRSLTA